MEEQVYVFFDESGKKDKEISLMGSLLIPLHFYNRPPLCNLNDKLKNKEMKLHFTDLTGDNFPKHKLALEALLTFSRSVKVNIVAFKKSHHVRNHSNKNSHIEKMIYSKIPERVLYGVLRDYGNYTDVNAKLFIEECTQYKKLNLNKSVQDQLNVHSLYRNENYWIDQAGLYSKNKEIGIELTDMILGIIRAIIENKTVTFTNGKPSNSNKSLWKRKSFIGKMVHQLSDLYSFLCNIHYFELDGHSTLEKKDIKSYLDLFLAKYDSEVLSQKESAKLVSQ